MIASPRARVAHAIPGRLRLRFERGVAVPEEIEALLVRLREQPGVRGARHSGASGSIVVEYDPAAVSQGALLRGLPVGPEPAPASLKRAARSSPAAHALTQCWWNADAALARATGGWLDLRTLVPLALAVLAVRQILRQGDLPAASWHALLWYSYNVFYHFHPELRLPPGQPEVSVAG